MVSTTVSSGRVSIWHIAGAALVKPLTEAALRPVVGDGTIVSGAVKGVAAVASAEYLGRKSPALGNIFGIAFGMDAAEDFYNHFGIMRKLSAATSPRLI